MVAKASSDACVLRESIANADVNAKERKRASADAANTAAQAANAAAQAAATNAQAALDAAIAAGAVLVEVQVKRAAALDTRTAAAAAKAAADAAAAALADAVAQKAVASVARNVARRMVSVASCAGPPPRNVPFGVEPPSRGPAACAMKANRGQTPKLL